MASLSIAQEDTRMKPGPALTKAPLQQHILVILCYWHHSYRAQSIPSWVACVADALKWWVQERTLLPSDIHETISVLYCNSIHHKLFRHFLEFIYLPTHHAWVSRIKDNHSRRLTNSDELFLNTWLITKTKFNISENNPKSRLTFSQHTKMSSLKRSSDHLRTFSATFGSLRKIVGNVRTFRIWANENLTHLTQK